MSQQSHDNEAPQWSDQDFQYEPLGSQEQVDHESGIGPETLLEQPVPKKEWKNQKPDSERISEIKDSEQQAEKKTLGEKKESSGSSAHDITNSFNDAVSFGGDGLIPINHINMFAITQSLYHSLVTSHRLIVKMSDKFKNVDIPDYTGDPNKKEDLFDKLSADTLNRSNKLFEQNHTNRQQPPELSSIEGYNKLNDVMIVSKYLVAENGNSSMSDFKKIFDYAKKAGNTKALEYIEQYLESRSRIDTKDKEQQQVDLLCKASGVKSNARSDEYADVVREVKRIRDTGKVNESVKSTLFTITEARVHAMGAFKQEQANEVTREFDKKQFGEEQLKKRASQGNRFTQNADNNWSEVSRSNNGQQK
jgi:hypothetical protein